MAPAGAAVPRGSPAPAAGRGGEAPRAPDADTVLRLVRELVAELGGPAGRAGVALDDSLDRDLGLGSLERVELVARVEHALGVRLPDAVVAEAETPRDLVIAAAAAGPRAVAAAAPLAPAPPLSAASAPPAARTLVDALRWHADAHPDRVHVFLRGDDGAEEPLAYGRLAEAAGVAAAGLRERGVGPGDRVALMLRTERAFFEVFLGALLVGAIPVPIYPPFRPRGIEEYARRQVGILRDAGARLLVTFAGAERIAALLRPRVPSLGDVTTADRLRLAGASAPAAAPGGDGPALIQYTSGSTGAPKGVLLTHANLLANIRAIGVAIGLRTDDVAVSWLPLYHDMGLIGAWLGSLYHGVPVTILSPLAFLVRPARWLRALHDHRGTLSPAPNFAFDLCVRKVRDEEIAGLDLAAWRLALNGSEPVSPETIARFTERFRPYGFRPEAMCPVYGLAEAAVGLTVSSAGRLPRIDAVERETFQRTRRAVPAVGEPAPLRFVGCGRALPGHEVRITGPDGTVRPDRVEGRIEFRGPSVTAGYWGNPAATAAAVHAGWMDSGDLGYAADGDLFVTGRSKDVIIKAGRNLYPQVVEEVVGDVPGVRKGRVAAFGVADAAIGTERLVVVAETREAGADARRRLRAAVLAAVVGALGVPPDVVVLAVPGAVLKTPSGKVRRSAMRQAYERGVVGRLPSPVHEWLGLRGAWLAGGLRRLATGVGRAAYGAWLAALLGATMPLLWALVLALPGRPRVDAVVRAWCRTVLALAGCGPGVEGVEHLAGGGPRVIVANHASYVDVVALLAALPVPVRFVAKRELARAPLVGAVIRRSGHLLVERVDVARSVADAARLADALRGGAALLFFPEGTFTRETGIMPFRLGAFKLAVEAGCEVIPVGIRGTRQVLPAERWLPRRHPVSVHVDPPLRPAGTDWHEIVRLAAAARAAIVRASGEPPVDRRPAPALPRNP